MCCRTGLSGRRRWAMNQGPKLGVSFFFWSELLSGNRTERFRFCLFENYNERTSARWSERATPHALLD